MSFGNTRISVLFSESGSLLVSVNGSRPGTVRNNLYDALSEYGVGYDAAKKIVKLFSQQQLPSFSVNLLKEDYKGHDWKPEEDE